jgi:hypothetical protein
MSIQASDDFLLTTCPCNVSDYEEAHNRISAGPPDRSQTCAKPTKIANKPQLFAESLVG